MYRSRLKRLPKPLIVQVKSCPNIECINNDQLGGCAKIATYYSSSCGQYYPMTGPARNLMARTRQREIDLHDALKKSERR